MYDPRNYSKVPERERVSQCPERNCCILSSCELLILGRELQAFDATQIAPHQPLAERQDISMRPEINLDACMIGTSECCTPRGTCLSGRSSSIWIRGLNQGGYMNLQHVQERIIDPHNLYPDNGLVNITSYDKPSLSIRLNISRLYLKNQCGGLRNEGVSLRTVCPFPCMQLRVRTEIKQKSEREPHHRGNPEPVLIIYRRSTVGDHADAERIAAWLRGPKP